MRSTPSLDLARTSGALLRGVLLGGTILLLTAGATWLWGRSAQSRLLEQHPAPGVLVDVGGRTMHLRCAGEGAPTVVLDAGLMDFSVHWAQVLPEVARFTRVCAFDRAGLGWSDPGPAPRTSTVMTKELRVLLTRAGLNPPYVLVGHSFGGLNARLYASRYPAEVAGLVLVDPAHEDQTRRIPGLRAAAAETLGQFRMLDTVSRLGLLTIAPGRIPDRGLPPDDLEAYRALLASTGYFREAARELEALETSFKEIRSASVWDLARLPLVVVSRARPDSVQGQDINSIETEWQSLQAEIAALSSNGRHLIAETSSHDIHLHQPALVAGAIRDLVQQLREPGHP